MIKARSVPIALDYAFGESAESLAAKNKCSVQRIHQRLAEVSFRLYASMGITMLRVDPNRTARLIHERLTPTLRFFEGGRAQTPEEFFFELLQERERYHR